MCTGHDEAIGATEASPGVRAGTGQRVNPAPSQQLSRGVSRRGFLGAAAASAAMVGAAGALAPPVAASEARHRGHHRVPVQGISVQLYTLRNQLAIDFEGTLAALYEIGYRKVEHAGFVGRTAAQFRAALDAHGLRATSGHVGIPQPFSADAWRASLADARTLGSRYIVHPFFGINFGTGEALRTTAGWRAFAADLNRAGRMARQAGLRLGYHNHQHEFLPLVDDPSRVPYDVLIEATDPHLVHLELDLYWSWRGAHDPVDILHRVGRRVRQFHVKDMNLAGSFEDAGRGLVDFGRIFAHAPNLDEFIIERDDAGSPPRTPADAISTAEVGYDYLRGLRY